MVGLIHVSIFEIYSSLINYCLSILTFNIPDEDYSRNVSCTLNYFRIFIGLPDLKGHVSFWRLSVICTLHISIFSSETTGSIEISGIMFRRFSTKRPHFVWIWQKNMADAGILFPDRPIYLYKNNLLLWN